MIVVNLQNNLLTNLLCIRVRDKYCACFFKGIKNFSFLIWKLKDVLRIIALPIKGKLDIKNDDSVAQPVEHYTFNVRVPGSSPGGITQNCQHTQALLRRRAFCLCSILSENLW